MVIVEKYNFSQAGSWKHPSKIASMRVSSTSSIHNITSKAIVAKTQQGNFQLFAPISRQYESNLTIFGTNAARRAHAQAASK
jgi:hypothetical protein